MAQINFYDKKIIKLNRNLPDNPSDTLEELREAMSKWTGAGQRDIFKLKEISLSLTDTVKLIGQLGNSTTFGHDQLDALTFKLAATSLFKPLN